MPPGTERTYVICVNRAGFLPEADPYEVEGLEAARDAACEEVHRSFDLPGYDANHSPAEHGHALDQANALGEGGGIVGPMPDGYVIDVSPREEVV